MGHEVDSTKTERRRFGAVLFAVVLISPLLIPEPAAATFPGSNGLIAFQSDDGNSEIWVMDGDGENKKQLTTGTHDFGPAWSPDGQRIAFHSFRDGDAGEIWVMDADGENQTRLTTNQSNDKNVSWAPDGSLVFESDRTGDFDLFTMDADGTNVDPLTNNSTNELNPSWSPDGTHIAFETDRDGGADSEIYIANASGTQPERLTGDGEESEPTWSPAGNRIFFTSERDDDEEKHLYAMDADGENEVRLTNDEWSDSTPTLSPDGTRLAFSSNRSGSGDIYVSSPTATGALRLTDSPRVESHPDWQPVPGPDGTPPQTTISAGPKATTNKLSASLTFSSSEPGSTFECRLDKKPFAACTSPKKYKGLAVKKYVFQVRATDAAGNVDATPAKRSWKVVR